MIIDTQLITNGHKFEYDVLADDELSSPEGIAEVISDSIEALELQAEEAGVALDWSRLSVRVRPGVQDNTLFFITEVPVAR